MCVTLHPKTVDNSWTTCVFSEQHQGLTNMHMWRHTVTKLRAEQLVGDDIIGYMSVLTSVSTNSTWTILAHSLTAYWFYDITMIMYSSNTCFTFFCFTNFVVILGHIRSLTTMFFYREMCTNSHVNASNNSLTNEHSYLCELLESSVTLVNLITG